MATDFAVLLLPLCCCSSQNEGFAVAHVPPAVQGFFRSVALGQASGDRTGNLQVRSGTSNTTIATCHPKLHRLLAAWTHMPALCQCTLQDILRLLTLWFNFGAYAEVSRCRRASTPPWP